MSKYNKIFLLFMQTAIVALVSSAIAWQYLDKSPTYDEFYHILAAKGYLAHGNFLIFEGVYERARIFTWLVAYSISIFGDNLFAARLPSLISGIGLICAVFLWLRCKYDVTTAWIASLLLSASPILVFAMQVSRFYTLHAFAFFLFTICAFTLFGSIKKFKNFDYLIFIFALFFLFLSYSLQISTFIGMSLLFVYGGAVMCLEFFKSHLSKNKKVIIVASLSLLILLLLAVFSSNIRNVFGIFRDYPLWATENIDNYLYYVYVLKDDYPILFAIYPALVVVAMSKYPQTTICFSIMFIGGLLVHSLAAIKGERFILYILPMFIITISIGLSVVLKNLYQILVNSLDKLWKDYTLISPVYHKKIINCIVAPLGVSIIALYFLTNTEGIKAAPLMFVSSEYTQPYLRYQTNPDWRKETAMLKTISDKSDVLISSAAVKAYYYFGRLDYDLNASIHNEVGPEEYAKDLRTGFKVVSNKSAIEEIYSENGSGLIILERGHLGKLQYVSQDIVDFIEANMEKVNVSANSQLWVYQWNK